jgi:hypothetical protein
MSSNHHPGVLMGWLTFGKNFRQKVILGAEIGTFRPDRIRDKLN